jgi:DNA-binding transcriptional LysR family regulator
MANLQGISLNRFIAFAAVIERGSFTAAAGALGVSKVVVSQHVARLEAELRCQLLIRTTRKMTLTEAGRQFYQECAALLRQAEEAVARLAHGREVPSGTLRVTATEDFGQTVLPRAVAKFLAEYPDVAVDCIISNAVSDLIDERLDLSIRVGWLRNSTLRAMRLGGFRQCVVAAPRYLKRFGSPKRPADLANHNWIQFSLLSQTRLSFVGSDKRTHHVRPRSRLTANSPAVMRAMLLENAGVSVLPEHMVFNDLVRKELIPLLMDYELPRGGIFAVHPYAPRAVPMKVRVFIDLLRDAVAQLPGTSGE